jgi:hypothetical protein
MTLFLISFFAGLCIGLWVRRMIVRSADEFDGYRCWAVWRFRLKREYGECRFQWRETVDAPHIYRTLISVP